MLLLVILKSLSRNAAAVLLVLLTSVYVSAQPSLEWIHQYGDSNDEIVNASTVDRYGNSFHAGEFKNSVDVDPGGGSLIFNNNGSRPYEGFIQKLDPLGNLIWALQVHEANDITAMCTDTIGNVYLAGYFRNEIFIGSMSAISGLGNGSIFVAKIDPNGSMVYLRSNSLAGGFGRVNDIDVDDSGTAYVTGTYYGAINGNSSAGGYDIFVLQLTANGGGVSTRIYGGSQSDYASDIVTDGTYYYLAGSYRGTASLSGSGSGYTQTSHGDYDSFIIQFQASNHTIVSVINLKGNLYENIQSIDLDADGNLYVLGAFSSTTELDPGSPAVVNPSSAGQYLVKYTNSGDYLNHVLLSTSVTGTVVSSKRTVFCDKQNSQVYAAYEIVQGLMGINRFDENLNLVWAESIEAATTNFDLEVDEYENVYLSGAILSSNGSINVGGSGFSYVSSAGDGDLIHLKWGQCQSSANTISASTCTSYTAPDGQQYSTAGQYIAVVSNSVGCDSIITINLSIDDLIAPVPDVTALPAITETCSVSALVPPMATDACEGAIVGTHNATLPITASTNITWTYDDGNGNTSTQTQEVIIDDVTAPIADEVSLTDITAECEVTSLSAPTATDNCEGTITGTHNASFPISTNTTVTWTYDDGNGNTSSQTQEVIIDDVTAPVADAASLTDITAECEVTSLSAPTATDNCEGTIIGTHNAIFPITESTTITWTYDDGNGNTSTQSQDIVISDVTAPVADVQTLSDVIAQCEITSLVAPTATDNCEGLITGTHNASLPVSSSTTVTWTYDDGNGNTSTQTQEVIIDDVTAPIADLASLNDVTDECEIVSLSSPTATDNCEGSITGTHNASFPITSSATVTWTYDDGNGNTSTQTQEIVITPVDNSVTMVNGVTLSADASGYTYQWVDCDNANSPISGETEQTFVATTNGNYAVEIDNGSCTVISDCIQILTVGIQNQNEHSVNVYPNPNDGRFYIEFSRFEDCTDLRLIDANGRLIYSDADCYAKRKELDFDLVAGIYFLEIQSKNHIERLRLVVQ